MTTGKRQDLPARLAQQRQHTRSTKTVAERVIGVEDEVDGHTVQLLLQSADVSALQGRVDELEQASGAGERTSETSFSFHPTGMRVKGKNWAPSNSVLLTFVVAAAIVAVVWLVLRYAFAHG
jgi:hypothetical protein